MCPLLVLYWSKIHEWGLQKKWSNQPKNGKKRKFIKKKRAQKP